jgi:hypothetical protein
MFALAVQPCRPSITGRAHAGKVVCWRDCAAPWALDKSYGTATTATRTSDVLLLLLSIAIAVL